MLCVDKEGRVTCFGQWTENDSHFLSATFRANVGSIILTFTLSPGRLCSRQRMPCQLGPAVNTKLIKVTAAMEHEPEIKLCYCEFLRSESHLLLWYYLAHPDQCRMPTRKSRKNLSSNPDSAIKKWCEVSFLKSQWLLQLEPQFPQEWVQELSPFEAHRIGIGMGLTWHHLSYSTQKRIMPYINARHYYNGIFPLEWVVCDDLYLFSLSNESSEAYHPHKVF